MSFKDLEERKSNPQPHAETPEEAEMRAKAMARHRAKEEARQAKHGGGAKRDTPGGGGAARGDPKHR